MKKLFVLSPFHYNYFINNVNAVWVAKNLFKNGDIYFYFLTYNTFKIDFEHNIFKTLELNEEHISYKLSCINESHSLEYILKYKQDFEFYFYFPESVFSYAFQMYGFIKHFDIQKYYFRNNTDIDYLDEHVFSKETYIFISSINENLVKKIFLKKLYITVLSNSIFSYFYGKTTVNTNIDLLFLMIDQLVKNNMKKDSSSIYHYLKENSVNSYNTMYKSIGESLKFLYMYIDFEDDTFNINNKETYKKLPYHYSIDDIPYFSNAIYNEKTDKLIPSKFTFSEVYLYLNSWFTVEEIYYKMIHIYEYLNINNKNEITEYYSPINISINLETIVDEIETLLEEEDYYSIHFTINMFYNNLQKYFIEEAIPLIECPYCIEGKIYNGKNKFFCCHCNFFLSKTNIKEKYGFDLTKRYLKILIKNKYITINVNGENRILFLRKSESGIFLTLLRKK